MTITPGGGPYWATSTASMQAIAALDEEVARRAFGDGHGIALGASSGWGDALHGRAWASLSDFEADLGSAAIDADVRVAMYDPEPWAHTPLDEQRDPITAIRRFVELARSRGFVSMVTPYPTLVSVPGSAHPIRPGETEEAAYVRSGIAAEAGAADVAETQAQRHQRDPGTYRDFVSATAAQARDANRDVVVLSGLSTSPGYAATPAMLLDAWASVRDVVDGHYVSLSKGRRTDVMVAFLRATLEANDA